MKQNQQTAQVKLPRIKKGDQVVVITGGDKGKTGRVLVVYPQKHRVLVEGLNVRKRTYKKGANNDLPEGGIHDKEMPIDISNVMLLDPKSGKHTRVGIQVETTSDGKTRRVRYAKASGTAFKD
jgi:large subunit ribosomal protein L24